MFKRQREVKEGTTHSCDSTGHEMTGITGTKFGGIINRSHPALAQTRPGGCVPKRSGRHQLLRETPKLGEDHRVRSDISVQRTDALRA